VPSNRNINLAKWCLIFDKIFGFGLLFMVLMLPWCLAGTTCDCFGIIGLKCGFLGVVVQQLDGAEKLVWYIENH